MRNHTPYIGTGNLVKVRPLAEMTGMSVFKIYQAVQEKTIPHYRFGRAVRFSAGEVLDWMKEQAGSQEP